MKLFNIFKKNKKKTTSDYVFFAATLSAAVFISEQMNDYKVESNLKQNRMNDYENFSFDDLPKVSEEQRKKIKEEFEKKRQQKTIDLNFIDNSETLKRVEAAEKVKKASLKREKLNLINDMSDTQSVEFVKSERKNKQALRYTK